MPLVGSSASDKDKVEPVKADEGVPARIRRGTLMARAFGGKGKEVGTP